MIKVFTVGNDSSTAGDKLTELITAWIKEQKRGIEILATHSNSNQYGWMVMITYRQK